MRIELREREGRVERVSTFYYYVGFAETARSVIRMSEAHLGLDWMEAQGRELRAKLCVFEMGN